MVTIFRLFGSILIVVCCTLLGVDSFAAEEKSPPNILVILADDLGYGDVGCYNPRGKFPTPNIDGLATAGMRFTDAHSSSGVCSPTRYSLLTGRYHWRSRLQRGIVGQWERPLIAADRLTIGSLAQRKNYRTACIGKWHLGWDWPIAPDDTAIIKEPWKPANQTPNIPSERQLRAWQATFSQPIAGGPSTRGFHQYFGTDVPNWPPYCFLENDRTVGVPSVFLPRQLLLNEQASQQGPALPDWKLDEILPTLAARACKFIATQAQAKQPFLLYFPLTSPHTPISVADQWRGKSKLDIPYADFVMQTDAVVGQVLAALEAAGVADHTLVIFTSDNGCAPGAWKKMATVEHASSGPFRGHKADAWEGGHRVPFIVRWQGNVRPGTTCEQTIGSVDIFATVAEVLGVKLPSDAGEDSVSLLPQLGGDDAAVHDAVVHMSAAGVFAIRSGPWKLILGPGSGPPTKDSAMQLYNLQDDVGETTNLAAEKPAEVARLTKLLQSMIDRGRSTPGENQQNDVPVVMVKKPSS